MIAPAISALPSSMFRAIAVSSPTVPRLTSLLSAADEHSLRSFSERWKHHRKYGASSRALEQKLALMLADDAVRHEQAKSGARLLGGEMRFEQVVAILLGDAGAVVRDAEERPPVVAPACCQLDMSMRGRGVDRVVDQVGDDLAQKQRIRLDFDRLRRLA